MNNCIECSKPCRFYRCYKCNYFHRELHVLYDIQDEQEQQEQQERHNTKRKCLHCRRGLQPIGNSRSNGKCHDDWEARKYHKKCWVKLQSWEEDRFDRSF